MIKKTIKINFLIYLFIINLTNNVLAENIDSIEIINPIFTTKGIDENQYEIKAEKGLQENDILYLKKIKGKLKTDDNIWIYLNADEGIFDQDKGIINLSKNIVVYTDNNEKIYSDYALVETKIDKITLDKNVKYENDIGLITADSSIIENNFSQINYAGNVKSSIKILNK